MSRDNKTVATSGVGFVGLLQILFIALKLTNVIDWKWIWVLLPLILEFGLSIVVMIGLLIYMKRRNEHGKHSRTSTKS